MHQTWERMKRIIMRHFPDRKEFDRILLAGGSGSAFLSQFEKWHPDLFVAQDAQLAIARGMLKYLLARDTQ